MPDSGTPQPPFTAAGAPSSLRNWIIVGAVILAALIYLAYSRRQMAPPSGGVGLLMSAPSVRGMAAPDWTLRDIQGHRVDLAQFKGHPIVLDFWATWCPPCRMEIPLWQQLQSQYRSQGLVIIGVSEDAGPGDVANFLKTTPLDYRVVMADSSLDGSWGVPEGLPITFFIGKDGKIRSRAVGLEAQSELTRRVQQIL